MRTVLPTRRASATFEMVFDHQIFQVSFHRDAQGLLREVFIRPEKGSSAIEDAARDIAVLTSLALQHGEEASTLRKALTRREQGKAGGIGSAVLDAIAQELDPEIERETEETS